MKPPTRDFPCPPPTSARKVKDAWALITNGIDHEIIHSGQVLEGRYESRTTQLPMARLIAEWFEERARFIGSLVGLSDEEFNCQTEEGVWTY